MRLDETFMPEGIRPAPVADAATLQVGAIQSRSHVAGPGVRSVVWVAGCHRRCPGCLKPDLFDFHAGGWYCKPGHTPWPVMQCRSIGRDVLVYTGYRHENLEREGDDGIRRLLAETDILVDGEYRAGLVNPGRWRGSANQRVLPLTSAGRRLTAPAFAGPALEEIQVSFDGARVRVSGCPDRSFFEHWAAELSRRGVVVSSQPGSNVD